jgi:phosphoribosylformylglycinamidine synthase subunit PurQ / glutaminase
MKFAILEFPGSNCDHDCEWVLKHVLKQKVEMVWHQDGSLPKGLDCVIVPGGFSYGDYLRCGAIARFSPVMKAVGEFAKKGGLIWGICNGFQILTEAGLLPGALIRNKSLSFICQDVFLKVENPNGALENIAGIINKEGRILGMMPHPERASEAELGNTDGRLLFESALNALSRH